MDDSSGSALLTLPRRWWWPLLVVLPYAGAGLFKGLGYSSVVGLDTTVLAVALLLATALVAAIRTGVPVADLSPLIPLVFLMFLHVLFAPDRFSTGYPQQKIVEFLLLTVLTAVAVGLLVREYAHLVSIDLVWLVLGGVAFIAGLPSLSVLGSRFGRLSIGQGGGGESGAVGYMCAVALVVLVIAWAVGRIQWWLALPASLALLYFVFGSGARGALLGLVAAALVTTLLMFNGPRIVKVALAVLALVTAVLIAIPDTALWRLSLEDSGRTWLWSMAWDGFTESPLVGHGFGSFALVSAAEYPHNILLETAYELGILGLAALLLVIGAAARNVVRYRRYPAVVALGAVTAFWLAGALVSLDLRHRYLWLCLVVCLVLKTALKDKGDARGVGKRRSTPASSPPIAVPGGTRPYAGAVNVAQERNLP